MSRALASKIYLQPTYVGFVVSAVETKQRTLH